MAQQHLDDVTHYWGNDLQLSSTGDLARSSGVERSKQHVLRRLLTNLGDYLVHTDFGAGLPADVGTNLDIPKLVAKARGQMQLEASVAQDPEPVVIANAIPNGVYLSIQYVVLPDRIPVALAFSLEA